MFISWRFLFALSAACIFIPSVSIADTLTIDGGLTVNKDLTIRRKIILRTTSNKPKNPCTPGELLLGPGGSNSNGKGGWFFFCRLGGTWAAADFSNVGSAVENLESEDELEKLREEVNSLKALVCVGAKDAEICKEKK